MGVTVIGGASAKFMWELIEARIRATAEIEKTLNKYQSLYRLYVKETGAAVTEERTQNRVRNSRRAGAESGRREFQIGTVQELIRKNPKASLATIRESQSAAEIGHSGSATSHLQSPAAPLRQDGVDSRAHELSQIL